MGSILPDEGPAGTPVTSPTAPRGTTVPSSPLLLYG